MRVRRLSLIAVLAAVLIALLAPINAPAAPLSQLSDTALRSRLLYLQRSARTTDRALALNQMAERSGFEAGLWTSFFAAWDQATNSQVLNYSTPKGLPTSGHVFVVLGGSLTSSGTITTQLTNRLKVALKALAAYPHSQVIVSGGAPKNGHTEAEVMRAWLIDNGVAAGRILTEAKSSSTVGNAANSMAIIKQHPEFTSYTLISDGSHLRRAGVLFDAAALNLQRKDGVAWPIRRVSNAAYKDKTITNPASDATTATIASNVAMLLDLSASYSAAVASPPAVAVFTGLAVTPATTTYQVGAKLSASQVVTKAVYDQGSLNVTGRVKITGFSSAKTGTVKVKVSYTDGKVTKTLTYPVTIVKASAKAKVSASTTTAKRKKTRVKVSVKLSTATGITATGKVRFMLGKKVLKTVSLDADDAGKASYTLPKFTSTGTKTVTVKYLGSSKVKAKTSTVKILVKR
ncbi:MAG: YdcF family protein [Propionibacteriales bacterium]|nr:YdcF family protein [Propionibacteriales bacterium]